MSKPSRTKLKPVYLTECERDLVVQAFDVLKITLTGVVPNGGAQKFANSYTSKRLSDVSDLFKDKIMKVSQ